MNRRGPKSRVWLVFAFVGFVLGAFLSWGVLSGDEQGRVNILYLLLVYLLLPLTSIVISTSSLLLGRGFNLAQCLRALPLWSWNQDKHWRKLIQQGNDSLWFFQVSQIVAISFSLAGLLVFFILLLSTDINFVWRSTLLSPEGLIDVLIWLSSPWRFWEGAQPSLELLKLTQDSRISPQNIPFSDYSGWWQFILAVQLFYSFLPRGVLLLINQVLLNRREARQQKSAVTNASTSASMNNNDVKLAPILTEIDERCLLTNWGDIPQFILDKLQDEMTANIGGQLEAGPMATEEKQAQAEFSKQAQIVLVKSWEPPLAELGDYLQHGKGYILPLDWESNQLKAVDRFHLQEWRRFTATIPKWKVLSWPEPDA